MRDGRCSVESTCVVPINTIEANVKSIGGNTIRSIPQWKKGDAANHPGSVSLIFRVKKYSFYERISKQLGYQKLRIRIKLRETPCARVNRNSPYLFSFIFLD